MTKAPESKEPVTVVGNRHGGVFELIENEKDPARRFHIMVKQGNRRAHLLGDLEFITEIEYNPGDPIEGARILILEQMTPFNGNPLDYLKMKEGKVCYKDGQPIYRKMYFTHNKQKQDVIIQEDQS